MAFRLGRILCSALVLLALSAATFAQIGIAVSFGPPPLPVYVQPPCPAEGYFWTPGYWAWDPDYGDYYWVPGTWVMVPQPGYYWTPGWWGWGGGGFLFHVGYWGPVVGFYGGINYGFGYYGNGYQGGRWDNGRFFYNRSVNNVNVTNIHNVYNTTVINNRAENRVSYNGGNGGVSAQPTSQEQAAERERHIAPVAAQTEQMQTARGNQQLRASVNHGKPPIAATPTPGAFEGHGVVGAKQAGGPYTPPPPNRAANAVHPNELPPVPRPPAPNTSNAEQNQKYQQQQEQLRAQQQQDRQKLQQQQEQEHQQAAKEQANEARQQQLEQQHQQQTQQMYQQHQQQQQQLNHQQQQQSHPSQGKPPKQ